MANNTNLKGFGLTPSTTPGQFTVSYNYGANYTVSDTSDGPNDDPTQIGDIQNDHFSTGFKNSLTFVGSADNGQGVIGSRGNYYYLYSNQSHNQGDTVTSQNQPFAVCYCSGSRIRILQDEAEREVAVEALQVGDLAVTASGGHRPIRWIGSRTMDPRQHPRPIEAQPVRIRAGALGNNRPARDLVVSPGHAICLDLLGEVLVPAIALVNGATIVQEHVDSVIYWHVELDSHDILIADGQPAESFLDLGNRVGFTAGTGPVDPDRQNSRADYCRPFLEDDTLLLALRRRLRSHAETLGFQLVPSSVAELHLTVDGQVLRPDWHGHVARFVLPASAQDVWLVSDTSIPAHVKDSRDQRVLGVDLHGLSIDDGLSVQRTVTLDDPALSEGLYPPEGSGAYVHRWTNGRARLPSSLWTGCCGSLFLRVAVNAVDLPRWVAPEACALAEIPVAAPRLRLVAA